MSFDWPPTGNQAVILLAAFLLAWYAVGLHLNRRRGAQLVRQVRDAVRVLGGSATIRWMGRSAFRIDAEQLSGSVSRLGLSVLLEPRETFLLWLVGRLAGRRDWLMLSAVLSGPAGPAFEAYHPKRRGAPDAARRIALEGWKAERVPGRSLLIAGRDADARALGQEVLQALAGIEVWGASLHPEEQRLTLSLPVPAAETRTGLPAIAVLPQLADLILRRSRKF
ncbi:MAG: hypothetical protein ACE147_03495 [Candidatus Methylomirabilales bacterium]